MLQTPMAARRGRQGTGSPPCRPRPRPLPPNPAPCAQLLKGKGTASKTAAKPAAKPAPKPAAKPAVKKAPSSRPGTERSGGAGYRQYSGEAAGR